MTSTSYQVNDSRWLLSKDKHFLLSNHVKRYPDVATIKRKFAVSILCSALRRNVKASCVEWAKSTRKEYILIRWALSFLEWGDF
jgi:hypothetical protein